MHAPPLVLLALAVLLPGRAAAADGEPYQIQIALGVARNRLLTEVLRDRLERELGDGLQAALGGLARVKVVPADNHELWPRIAELGLQRALEGWPKRGNLKTHFLLIDYADGFYHVRGLQHDGFTGTAGPVVRHEQTRDRDFVARLAALMVEQDLGLLGTVGQPVDAGRRTTLTLRGPATTVWSRWVEPGDVFALVEAPGGDAGATEPIDAAYLQVVEPPRDGKVECKVANRYVLPSLVGCRAIKLGTAAREVPLRVRLVASGAGAAEPFLLLNSRGFDTADSDQVVVRLQRGVYDSAGLDKGTFSNLVYVTVKEGDEAIAQVPVPLVGLPEVRIAFTPGKKDDRLKGLRESWERSVAEAYIVQTDQMKRLRELAGTAEKRGEAIELARRAIASTQSNALRLRLARAALKGDASNLADSDRRLAKLTQTEEELKGFLEGLEKIEAEASNPEIAAALARVEEAKLLLAAGEIGKALDIYKSLRGKPGIDAASMEARIASLEKDWEPKSEAHKAARDFIYNIWPTLPTELVLARLEEARTAFAECRKVGDRLGATRLLNANVAHGGQLEKDRQALRSVTTPEERARAETINKAAEELQKFSKEIDEFLKQRSP